ncbi:hypothetical protein BRYFOR_06856 [Marvinbryantia formatexigens DSM 14469]|uniref:Uncharacterized protein n=1 Tax=Marvinbryantia formatexigens DSM 14469 TaxID=478749 RepID=C6LE06_9FIRM|nr:hypothetical protein BRYFOR_06856 [Marvinbryantia formatexigens DSM 14469]
MLLFAITLFLSFTAHSLRGFSPVSASAVFYASYQFIFSIEFYFAFYLRIIIHPFSSVVNRKFL